MLQVIHEPHPLSGAENMRIDEELLNLAATSERSTLRFYEWNEPTISLGYFQKDLAVPNTFAGLPVVTRLSGGGAILHHHELTYSLAIPKAALDVKPTAWYQRFHAIIIDCFREFGLECHLRGDAASDPAVKTFLCFARSDPNDIVHGGNKVVGSAQRRRRGAILQHGSLLLRASPYAPDIPGISDLGARPVASVELAEMIESRFRPVFG